ncbi:MAG: 16S rRNA (uracil(1498)-N(3))-methyltransferase [Tidjanibacter sp.]|nr:16S rRNA (uracil(1498)-N(3))-methyltransferase [Tidjanibacter sp.]
MQLFYSPDITPPLYTLSEEESGHCVRVLRLKEGDSLHITDGKGTLYRAEVEDAHPKRCTIRIVEEHHEWEKRPYSLTIAVAPTKNIDRIEWFVEKATECGIDRIVPILCDHSERKVIKGERLEKIAISAMKQSLKAYLPTIAPLTPIRTLLEEPFDGVRLIAHCEEDMERIFMGELIDKGDNVMVLIGPEGDFSKEEIEAARKAGFREVTLGKERLRTETAALAAAMFTAFVNN